MRDGGIGRLATCHGSREGSGGPSGTSGGLGVTAPTQRRPQSGGVMPPSDEVEETLNQWSRNPLLCWLCDELYDDPRILSCYHDFCSRCLAPRAVDGKIFCPLCGKVTTLKEGQLPPRDNLMTFLVESSCEERPPCANCEKSNQGIFFCNTCGQALCGHCREETHRARMFSLHDIIHMSKRGREINKKCAIHGEPFIMFSTTKRTMLCINCFRESSADARMHCVDIDSAYGQGSKKLDRAIMLPGETLIDIDTAYQQARIKLDRAAGSIRELQNSVRDGVVLFKALLDELRKNTEAEKYSVTTLVDNLQDAVRRTQDHLFREVDGQYDVKDKLFRSQLSSLGALLPIIQVHLLMCTTFSSSASKYEFLDLVFKLMERLAAIAHLSHPLRPAQSSQIRTNYKSEFSRSLEPLLSVSSKRRSDPNAGIDKSAGGVHSTSDSCASRSATSAIATSRRSLSAAKLKILESGGPFSDHCKGHEAKFRELSAKFTRLKEEAQELHRDVTLKRCLTRRGRVEEIVRECAALEDEFRLYGEELEDLRVIFDSAWEEQIQRIYAEQEVFQSQVNDIVSIRDENKRLMIIAQQFEPYIRAITALMERISPKLQVPQPQVMDNQDNVNVNSVMQQILDQITSCKPEPQIRVESLGCGGEGPCSRGSTLIDDPAGLLMSGIPKPPDPPQSRRTPEQDDQDHHGFSPRPFCARHEAGISRSVVSPSSLGSSGLVTGERRKARRKRQNSEGDSLIWAEHRDWPPPGKGALLQRRGSEGSEVDTRKTGGVLAQLLDKVRHRDRSKEGKQHHSSTSQRDYESDIDESTIRARTIRRKGVNNRADATERFIDRAAASFDASAVPERPKSACESTLLRAAEKLYSAAAAARPSASQRGRRSAERLSDIRGGARSRESSGGRTRSAEREPRAKVSGIVLAPPQRVPGGLSMSEVQAMVHVDGIVRRQEGGFSTVPRKGSGGRKENIYENVPFEAHTLQKEMRSRPIFKKQSSLDDCIPYDAGRGRVGGTYRKTEAAVCAAVAAVVTSSDVGRRTPHLEKADSFEGHEEAVRTLVAAVQENRILRRKKTK